MGRLASELRESQLASEGNWKALETKTEKLRQREEAVAKMSQQLEALSEDIHVWQSHAEAKENEERSASKLLSSELNSCKLDLEDAGLF